MNLRVLNFLIFAPLFIWLALSVWVVGVLEDRILIVKFTVVAGFFILPSILFWFGFTFYLMNRLVPKVDDIVDPEIVETLKRRGDDWFSKFHRLTLYALSSVNTRLNRRDFDHYDFSQLPPQLLLPLKVYQYWQWLIGVAMAIGYSFMKLVE
ncbi:hypothetical protein [Marinobacter caseinilyticus]|uniref:hypothetical protein n=1 Tax=Marinobacter caseinilyticus TaxID=2692195 RepID=UPI00140C1FAE|nr:hypothetical protein [Marinobacter caseinilyticus]